MQTRSVSPLESRGNYSATSNNTKLVHWPLTGWLLHLVQRGGARAGFEPDPDYSPDTGTGLLSPLSNKRWYTEFYVGNIRRIRIGRCIDAWFYNNLVLFTDPVSPRNTFVGGTSAPPNALLVVTVSVPCTRRRRRHRVVVEDRSVAPV